jgi:NitT/TauT family transport system substrate-binding protein
MTRSVLPRRELLRGAALGAGALTLGGAATAAPALARGGVFNVVKARPKVTLGWGGGTCEAPLWAAYYKGFFAAEGLDVDVFKISAGYTSSELMASGKLNGAPGIFFTFLKPIEQGADIRLTGGLHTNCIRVVVAKNAGITKAADFKGKSIGVSAIGDPGMSLFTLLLAENGVDPQRDVTWKVYAPTLYGAAIDKGEIQAVASPDPFAYVLVLQGKALQVGSNILGLFGNTSGLTVHKYCCAIALSGQLVRDQPKVAAAVTRAWMKGSRYVGGHTHEVSVIETANKRVTLAQPIAEQLLNSYRWVPSSTLIQQDIIAGARSFKKSGFLDSNTDPDKLARVAYVDIFRAAGQPVPTF